MTSFWTKRFLLLGMCYLKLCEICSGIPSPSEPICRDAIRSKSFTVSWTAVAWAKSYQVKVIPTAKVKPTSFQNCVDAIDSDADSPFTVSMSNFQQIQPRTQYYLGVCTNPFFGSSSEAPTVEKNIATGPSAPTNIQISSSYSTTLEVQWNDNDINPFDDGHVNGYEITYKIFANEPGQTATTNTDNPLSTSITINGLSANTDYIITVVSLTTDPKITSDASVPKTGTTLLSQPKTVQLTGNTSSSSVSINWQEPDIGGGAQSIQSYDVFCNPSGCNSTITETTATVYDLASNTNHSITVAAVTTSGKLGMYAEPVLVTTLLSQPTTLQLTGSTSSSSVSISWQEPDIGGGALSIQGYDVVCNPSGCNSNISGTTASVYDLASNANHSITVASVSTSGELGTSTEPLYITTLLSQPTTLQLAENTSTSSVSISWQEPDLGGGAESIQGYDVICNPSGCNSTITGTTATVYDLASNTNHAITVAGVTTSGELGMSADPVHVTTLPGAPTSASNVQPKVTNKTITIAWDKPDGGEAITNYSVEYKVHEETKNNYMTEAVVNHMVGISMYNYTIEDLVPGQNYDLKIVASNIEGIGTPLLETKRTKPDPIQDLHASQNQMEKEHLINLSWMKPAGVGDNITIMYTGSHDMSNALITLAFKEQSYSLGVQPGNIYNITLSTLSGNLQSSPKSTILNSKPSLPNNIQLSSNSSAIIVTWGVLEGYADWIGLKIDDGEVLQTEPYVNSFEFSNLMPNTEYIISMYSAIFISNGNLDESARYIQNINTEPVPPGGGDVVLIVGLVIAAIVVVLIIACGVYCYRRRKRKTVMPPPEETKLETLSEKAVHNSTKTYIGSPSQDTSSVNPNAQVVDSSSTDVGSRTVNLSGFSEYMTTMQAHDNAKFKEEFETLKPIGRNQSSDVGLHPDNKPKNRYKNILPYDNNRVQLDQMNDDPSSDYINASYIAGITATKEYIATQGPLPETVDDFWKLVWEQNCRNIVMVTQTVESGKVKCEKYWPSHLDSDTCGDLTIKTVSENLDNDWCWRRFKVAKDCNERHISHFNFTSWPDHGVPETTESLVKFIRFVKRNIDDEDNAGGPMVIHCSAGVGRTGTFIAMDRLLQHLRENSYVDIFGIIYQMRMQRMCMVQTEKQYILLHKLVQELVECAYELNAGEGDPLYENISHYQNVTPSNPVYENTRLSK